MDISPTTETPDWKLRQIETDTKNQLAWQEREIGTHTEKLCERFREIHDKKLYRFGYSTFDEYCDKRWGMKRSRAYQIIQAATAKDGLLALCADDPETARKVECLADTSLAVASQHKPAKVVRALRSMDSKPTAAALKKKLGPKIVTLEPMEPARKCPHCGGEI